MKKDLVTSTILAAFIVALLSCKFNKDGTSTQSPAVITTQAVLQPWQETIQVIGSLSASQGIDIKPEINGRIIGVYFRSGDNVKAGDPLLQLNPSIFQAQLDIEKAQTELEAANYARASVLYKKKVIAKQDMDEAFAKYRAQQAKQANAQAALDQTLIRAPFTGRLGLRLIDLGDYIDATRTIAHLDALDPLRVDFKIPGTDTNKVRLGTKLILRSDAYPQQDFLATVYAIDSQIDTDTRSLAVRATLDNHRKQLLPGAFVTVSVHVSQSKQFISVPETAINADESGSYVYRIINRNAVKTPVTVAFQRDGNIALSAGLQQGEQIISVGSLKVHDGMPVTITK